MKASKTILWVLLLIKFSGWDTSKLCLHFFGNVPAQSHCYLRYVQCGGKLPPVPLKIHALSEKGHIAPQVLEQGACRHVNSIQVVVDIVQDDLQWMRLAWICKMHRKLPVNNSSTHFCPVNAEVYIGHFSRGGAMCARTVTTLVTAPIMQRAAFWCFSNLIWRDEGRFGLIWATPCRLEETILGRYVERDEFAWSYPIDVQWESMWHMWQTNSQPAPRVEGLSAASRCLT